MFQAHEHHDFLNRYPCSWPVEEFLKTYLKNKHAYARKQGYPTESNQKQDMQDDDEEQDDEPEEAQKKQDDEEEQDEDEDMEAE